MANLRKLARGESCMIRLPGICNFDAQTTVLAHYRLIGLSGMSFKVPDELGSYACSACHEAVDTHHDSVTRLAHAEGVMRTIALLVRRGVLKS